MPAAVSRALVALAAAAALVATAEAVLDVRPAGSRATAFVVLEAHREAQHVAPRSRARIGRPSLPHRSRGAPPTAAVPALVPDDPLWPASWSLARVGAPAAWRVSTGTPEIVVAVVDTGIDPRHPDLRGALVPGWDSVGEDADASDDHGHGTAVAGVVAARSDNGVGVTGACWRCSLMPVKVIAANGTGTATDIVEGLRWAADHGADVINLSFVMTGPDSGVAEAIDYARGKGALVVAAAGNSGSTVPTFPASHPGVISVTATDVADARYGWATHGPWVSLAAPGCSQSTLLGGRYGEFCGTSAATALTSGMIALVMSALSNADGAVVYSLLATRAARVGGFVAAGRLDVAASLPRPATSTRAAMTLKS